MFDIPKAIEEVANLADDIVTRIWPDATEIEKAKLAQAMQEMQNQYQLILSQIDINKIEAASPSLFVSGWRPAVGWICAVGLGYAVLLEPLSRFIAAVVFGYMGVFPIIDTTITLQLLFALLGFGAARTFEGVKGVKRV
jgi:hypothetical protein